MKQEIKVGDDMRFKSSGRKVTVSSVEGYKIKVFWFANFKFHRYTTTRKYLVRIRGRK